MTVPRRPLAGVAVALAVLGAALVSPRAVLGPIQALADRPLLFAVGVVTLYLLRPFLGLPTTLCAVVVGYGYGLYGIPVALLGAAVTSLPPFYAARWAMAGDRSASTPDGIAGIVVVSAERVRVAGDRYFSAAGGVRGVTAARLAPVPADLVTCAAGVADVRVRSLVVGTVVGEVPWTVGAVLLGASAGRLTELGEVRAVGTPVVAASLAAAALLLAPSLYRYLRDRERST